MVPADHLIAFALMSFLLIIVPGPNVMFIISRSLMLGRTAGVGTALGGQIGVYVQVVAVAFGIGAVVERSAAFLTVLKLIGAAYLVYLGVQALRHRNDLGEALSAGTEPKSVRRILRDGFLVGLTNPKAVVFFMAVLPQFVDPAAGHVPLQMLLLGAIFAAIAVFCDSAWALVAGTARTWLARSPRRLKMVGGTGGLVLIGIGASLALTGRSD
ncbi:MAG: LysE family translocator [Nocardiopsaceae bacterium]|jgi:threonine/homoserine/homoserine lactone efflux protein|nr:LysE family translocator [Nocardiopsaceae bacterium]